MTHRQGSATARIAIHLSEDHPRQRQRFIKGFGGIHRILTDHGVDHEQGFNGVGGGVDLLDLSHHLVVNSQSAGSINNQYIDKFLLGTIYSGVNNGDRLLIDITGEELGAHFSGQGLELLNSGRTINIRRDHHDLFLFSLAQEARQFGNRSGFTCTLQTGHQNNCRRLRG